MSDRFLEFVLGSEAAETAAGGINLEIDPSDR